MGKYLTLIAWLLAGPAIGGQGERAAEEPVKESGAPDTVLLGNDVACMTINRTGGAISSFVLAHQALNPFSWKSADQAWSTSRKEGLFTCFDRVGRPSEAMRKAGIPFHGEAASVRWDVLEQSVLPDGCQVLKMRCMLPVANMTLIREFRLYADSSVCRVSDRVRNDNPFPKDFNILLHPSLGPPFLDETVLVDCSASTGFLKNAPLNELEKHSVSWPVIDLEDRAVDLSRMKDPVGLVANFVGNESAAFGWGCVSNPGRGLLTGCLWETADYPWIRVWREWEDDRPKALGIEFGTTPIGKPLAEVRAIGNVLDRPIIERLQPGAEVTKEFYLFLAEIPNNYTGVRHVEVTDTGIRIDEKNPAGQPGLLFEFNE